MEEEKSKSQLEAEDTLIDKEKEENSSSNSSSSGSNSNSSGKESLDKSNDDLKRATTDIGKIGVSPLVRPKELDLSK